MPGRSAPRRRHAFPIECFDELIAWARRLLPTLDRRVEPVIVGTYPSARIIDVGGAPLLIRGHDWNVRHC
jgi:hypothetical protein